MQLRLATQRTGTKPSKCGQMDAGALGGGCPTELEAGPTSVGGIGSEEESIITAARPEGKK